MLISLSSAGQELDGVADESCYSGSMSMIEYIVRPVLTSNCALWNDVSCRWFQVQYMAGPGPRPKVDDETETTTWLELGTSYREVQAMSPCFRACHECRTMTWDQQARSLFCAWRGMAVWGLKYRKSFHNKAIAQACKNIRTAWLQTTASLSPPVRQLFIQKLMKVYIHFC